MYSNILVAVDGSEASLHALRHATQLARGLSAALHIVHVVDMSWLPVAPELAIDVETLTAARRRAGEQTLAAAREVAREAGVDADAALVETDTPVQHLAEAIVKAGLAWPADLFVVGSHGRRGFQRLMLGSVAEGIARRSPVPVLLVPAPHTASA